MEDKLIIYNTYLQNAMEILIAHISNVLSNLCILHLYNFLTNKITHRERSFIQERKRNLKLKH